MKDVLEKLWAAIRHNQGLAMALILAAALTVYVVGCESQTKSIIDPAKTVNREELQYELESEVQRLEADIEKVKFMAEQRGKDLDRQDEFKAALVNIGLTVAEGQTVTPVGLATTLLVSLGLLAVAGCPMTAPLVDDTLLGLQPGSYYVDQIDGELSYYQLPQWRGDESGWVALNDESIWYQGPGFYKLSENYEWSWDETREGLTLDEFLQLYDPLPPVPNPS